MMNTPGDGGKPIKKKYVKPIIETFEATPDGPFLAASCTPLSNCWPDLCWPIWTCMPDFCWPWVCPP